MNTKTQPVASEPSSGERAELLREFENAVDHLARLHVTHMGKAMSDEKYSTFTKLRDETIPNLRTALLSSDAKPATKKWAQCPETDTPCSHCPTAGVPCEAAKTASEPVAVPQWLNTEMLRELVVRNALAIDQNADLESWPEALAFQCDMAKAIIAELPVPLAEQPGYKLVPVDPTEKMLLAAIELEVRTLNDWDDEPHHSEIYSAMINAAPSPAPVGIKKENHDI